MSWFNVTSGDATAKLSPGRTVIRNEALPENVKPRSTVAPPRKILLSECDQPVQV